MGMTRVCEVSEEERREREKKNRKQEMDSVISLSCKTQILLPIRSFILSHTRPD